MDSLASHPVPSRGAVAREQLRAVGLTVHREALAAGLLLALATALVLWTHVRSLSDPEYDGMFNLLPMVSFPVVLLGLAAPLAVWKGESPSHRGYLWSLPVDRGRLQLTKNAVGWLWLMGAVALYMAWAWAMAALTGGEIGENDIRLFVGESIRRATPGEWRTIENATPGWQWAVPFTAATVTYLLGSIPVLASNHPWRWLVGIWLGFVLLDGVTELGELQEANEALWSVLGGRYGLNPVVTGQVNVTREYLSLAGEARTVNYDAPDLQAWVLATLLWMGIGVVGTLLAATRHREP